MVLYDAMCHNIIYYDVMRCRKLYDVITVYMIYHLCHVSYLKETVKVLMMY